MTTPPPPPGGGDNQPYNPSGSNPYPSSGSGSTPSDPTSGAPSYGSAPGGGMPPQAPPPGFGPQGGGSDKGKTLSIVSLATGILGLFCCGCFVFGIVAIVTGMMAKKEATDPQNLKFAKIGFILGIVGLVLGLLYWIITIATGGFSYNLQTS